MGSTCGMPQVLPISIDLFTHPYYFKLKTMKSNIILLIALLLISYTSKAQTIITAAGSTGGTYVGDGGPATDANLGGPYGVAIDAMGNLFIADHENSRVRKVTPAGIITTEVGNGLDGETGDGGPATNALIGAPIGVAFDPTGNLYIASVADSNRIRKISTAGIITTIAGGVSNVYGGDGGPATAAGFRSVYDVITDNRGNIYISDLQDSRVRKIDAAGIISTYAGTGTAGYNGDNIAATVAQINFPKGLAVDDTGNLYVCDYLNRRVRKIDTFGIITTIAGNGINAFAGDGTPATAASLTYPAGVATDHAGNIYIADGLRVREIDTAGIINTIAGCGGIVANYGDGGPATAAEFVQTAGIKVGADGSIYIADYVAVRVRKIVHDAPSESLSSGKLTKKGEGLLLSPNPTSGAMTIQSPEAGSFVVYNMVGQQVAAYKVASGATDVRLPAALADGVYMGVYKADDGGAQQMVRVVVEK